jgi:hypothetical protein
MGLLRFILLVILGAGLSLALAAWRHVPDGPQPLFERMQAHITRAVEDLPELGTLAAEAERAEQAVLTDTEMPADETPATPPATTETPSTDEAPATGEAPADAAPEAAPADTRADAVAAANAVREEARTLLDARQRTQFWYEVALGTGLALFGGFLGGIGRRRRVAVAEYP